MGDLESLETIFVVKHTGEDAEMKDGRDVWYHDALEAADDECEAEALDAEHPLYILYSSGSTAKPKGILHTTGGYLTHVAWTHKYVFDLKPDEDVWWCSADVGWVTGHSYIVYGPLMNGATSVMYEGAPDYPDKDIWWELCDRYGVTLFYTAPTAIRACIKWGAKYPERHDLSKLRLLGTVGEPINPKAWLWYWKVIGGERCPVVDTWWQTETGGIMITTLPGAQYAKPGSAGQPLPGIDAADHRRRRQRAHRRAGPARPAPAVAGDAAHPLQGRGPLHRDLLLALRQRELPRRRRGPQGLRRLLLDRRARRRRHQRLRPPPVDGRGRVGDRRAPARWPRRPSWRMADEDTGQAIVAYVTLEGDLEGSDELVTELREHVAQRIGKLARPRRIIWSGDLPKTRSGKIMRRLLRDIAEGRELGDVTTLRDPAIMDELKQKVAERADSED